MGGRGAAGRSQHRVEQHGDRAAPDPVPEPPQPSPSTPDATDGPTPTEQVRPDDRPTPVSGALSDQPLAENGFGYAPHLPVNYHDDGPIGTAVKGMGADARMDIDGQPLGNVLGTLATDAEAGRRSAQQALDEFKTIRDRLPEGSTARARLDWAINDMDAPATPPPAVPDSAPQPLRKLASDLHAVPLVRRAPGPEQDALHQIINNFDTGRTSGQRLIRQVRQLANRRHESLGDSGKYEIDRAVASAVDALSKMDRKALHPAETKTTPDAGQTPPTPATDRPNTGRPRRQPVDTGAVAAALGKATSRAEAARHLDGLSVAQLHQVGEQAGITTYRSDPKPRLRQSLIEGLTGRRLDSDAILNHARRTEPGTPGEDGPGFTRAYPDA